MKHKLSFCLLSMLFFQLCIMEIPGIRKGLNSLYKNIYLLIRLFIFLDNLYSVSAINSLNVSMIEPLGIWSEILENWTISDSKITRMSKVMKLGDKSLTVTSKISMPNKREVSETDLYLLGKIIIKKWIIE